jgi:hypothetical protein
MDIFHDVHDFICIHKYFKLQTTPVYQFWQKFAITAQYTIEKDVVIVVKTDFDFITTK